MVSLVVPAMIDEAEVCLEEKDVLACCSLPKALWIYGYYLI